MTFDFHLHINSKVLTNTFLVLIQLEALHASVHTTETTLFGTFLGSPMGHQLILSAKLFLGNKLTKWCEFGHLVALGWKRNMQ